MHLAFRKEILLYQSHRSSNKIGNKLNKNWNCIYSRKSKEGNGEDTEAGGDGLAYPRLRNFVSVPDCSDSHLNQREGVLYRYIGIINQGWRQSHKKRLTSCTDLHWCKTNVTDVWFGLNLSYTIVEWARLPVPDVLHKNCKQTYSWHSLR